MGGAPQFQNNQGVESRTLELRFLKLQLKEIVNTWKEALSNNIEFDMWGSSLFSFTKRLEK
jgi:hypothetical protein